MAEIALEDIFVRYNDKSILSSINFVAPEAQVVAVVGPSGCGKTTLLLALAGLITPHRGNRVLKDMASNTEVVYLPQQDALLPWRSIRANVGLGRELCTGAPTPIELIEEWASRFNAAEFLDKRVHELSGGMRKRICLARTFCAEPSITLLDEPFNNLDYMDRERVEIFLRDWVSEHRRAAVCITHDIEQAVAIADQIAHFTRPLQRLNGVPPQFGMTKVPDILRQCSPSERRAHPEFPAFVDEIRHAHG